MDIGTAYYPEQWSSERWGRDADLMRAAGVSFARMGEFAWHEMEKEPGAYDFAWLVEAVDTLGERGIDTILCTPTAIYPAWLHAASPDLHQIASDGRVREWGQRQDACRNHPVYREKALAVTKALLDALGDHPRVIAWQTDNEFGNHDSTMCYCPHCESAYREWLRDRYDGRIESLNRAWGTVFWSHTYNSFDEVSVPRDTGDNRGGAGHNPGLYLDFRRFSSDSVVRFHRELVDIIRASSPGREITTNFMKDFTAVDYFDLAAVTDVVSWDNYPFYELDGVDRPPSPFPHDLMRGLKAKNTWIMEQAAGPGGWEIMHPNHAPGVMRLWAWQSVAYGADRLCFFRWRTARFGTEQYWHGILPHHGEPRRRYAEIAEFGAEINRVAPLLLDTRPVSDVAIVYDWDSVWAIEHQPQAARGFSFHDLARRIADVFHGRGMEIDVVDPGVDFSGYQTVFLPSQFIADERIASRLRLFAENGGIVVFGPRSGVKDRHNAVVEDVLPGPFREMAGAEVEEYDPIGSRKGLRARVDGFGLEGAAAEGMGDILLPDEGTEVLLTWRDAWYSGRAAATEHAVGRGRCVYLGVVLGREDLGTFLEYMHILSPPLALTPCVETALRVDGERKFRFYLNHSAEAVLCRALSPGKDVLAGKAVVADLELGPYGIAIVSETESAI